MKNEKINEYIERFLNEGGESLSDREYFELLMSYSAKSDFEKLYSDYGSFKAAADADTEFLISSGTDQPTAVLLKIISAMSNVYQRNFNTISNLKTSDMAKAFFAQLFTGAERENFVIVSVGKNFRIATVSNIVKGSMMSVMASNRMIADFVIKNKADRVFAAHNHPIGNAYASENDIVFTEKMISVLNALGTLLIDHIIIGMNDSFSMRSSGVCPKLNEQPDFGYK